MLRENGRVLSTFLRYQRQHPKARLPSVTPNLTLLDIDEVSRLYEVCHALNLKKSKAVTVRSRLDDLEQRLNKLALLVTQ